MSIFAGDFWEKAQIALRALDLQPELASTVQAEVDEFFAKYPSLHRTRIAEAFIASLVIERLSSADQPPIQKVA